MLVIHVRAAFRIERQFPTPLHAHTCTKRVRDPLALRVRADTLMPRHTQPQIELKTKGTRSGGDLLSRLEPARRTVAFANHLEVKLQVHPCAVSSRQRKLASLPAGS